MPRIGTRIGDAIVVVLLLATAAESYHEVEHYCPTVEDACIPVGVGFFFVSVVIAVCWAGYRAWSAIRRRHPDGPAEPPKMG
ncbi:MAG: hypothetical protein R2878_14440 [Thermoleophilia bacterium]